MVRHCGCVDTADGLRFCLLQSEERAVRVDEGGGADAADYLDGGYVCFVVIVARFVRCGRWTE